MNLLLVPAAFPPKFDDCNEAVILLLRRALLTVDMRRVTARVAFKILRNNNIVHPDIPVGAIITSRFPGMNDANDTCLLRVTGRTEPAVIGHQFREQLPSLSRVILGALLNKLPDNAGQYRWLGMPAGRGFGFGRPDIWTRKIIWVIMAKHNMRNHSVLPLRIKQRHDFQPGTPFIEVPYAKGSETRIPVPLIGV